MTRAWVAWDVFCSYLSDLRLWWYRRRNGLVMARYEWQPVCLPFYGLNSPWAMLDRELVLSMAVAAGYRLEDIKRCRPFYGPPADIFNRPWTPSV